MSGPVQIPVRPTYLNNPGPRYLKDNSPKVKHEMLPIAAIVLLSTQQQYMENLEGLTCKLVVLEKS